jgi:hypothetical protein
VPATPVVFDFYTLSDAAPLDNRSNDTSTPKEGTMANGSTGNTGTPDLVYNLVSVLYHALQGAETDDKYIRDAEQSGNQDLVQFFRDVKDRNKQIGDRAKQLLGTQLR